MYVCMYNLDRVRSRITTSNSYLLLQFISLFSISISNEGTFLTILTVVQD